MSPTVPEILERLAGLRERLPAERAQPLAPDSTWLLPAGRDERLIWALEQAGAVMTELDQDARILWVSPSVERILGYLPEEFRGLYVGDRVHPDDLERLVDVSQAMGDGCAPDRPRLRVRHKDGHWVHLEAISAARFRVPGGGIHSVSVLCDVSDRQNAWAALRASEERYRVIAEASRDMIAEVDEDVRYTFSTGMEQLLGYTVAELTAMEPFGIVHEEDKARVAEQLALSFEKGVTVRIDPFRLRRADGRWIWYECTGLVYRTAGGSRRFLTVGRDVTERLRQEQERLDFEARRQQTQRLESLGMLAGGIAHDFNNLLTPILGEAGLALADLPPDSPLRERLERILRAARRGTELTQQMVANAGAEVLRVEPVDVSALVQQSAGRLGEAHACDAELHWDLKDGLAVDGDAAQLGQVVTHLLCNALEAMEGRPGRVAVRTGEVELSGSDANLAGGIHPLPPGRYAFVEVEDAGCGMDEETRSRIFDPFFSTKFPGRGLGLAAVLGIVRGHEGGLEVHSEPGRGTRFRVLLPRRASRD